VEGQWKSKTLHRSWWNFARISPPVQGRFWFRFDPPYHPHLGLGVPKTLNMTFLKTVYKTKDVQAGYKLTRVPQLAVNKKRTHLLSKSQNQFLISIFLLTTFFFPLFNNAVTSSHRFLSRIFKGELESKKVKRRPIKLEIFHQHRQTGHLHYK